MNGVLRPGRAIQRIEAGAGSSGGSPRRLARNDFIPGSRDPRGQRIGAVAQMTRMIIIDPHTGQLLAYEQTAQRDPGGLGITTPTVLSYTLYLAQDHTATVQQL